MQDTDLCSSFSKGLCIILDACCRSALHGSCDTSPKSASPLPLVLCALAAAARVDSAAGSAAALAMGGFGEEATAELESCAACCMGGFVAGACFAAQDAATSAFGSLLRLEPEPPFTGGKTLSKPARDFCSEPVGRALRRFAAASASSSESLSMERPSNAAWISAGKWSVSRLRLFVGAALLIRAGAGRATALETCCASSSSLDELDPAYCWRPCIPCDSWAVIHSALADLQACSSSYKVYSIYLRSL